MSGVVCKEKAGRACWAALVCRPGDVERDRISSCFSVLLVYIRSSESVILVLMWFGFFF